MRKTFILLLALVASTALAQKYLNVNQLENKWTSCSMKVEGGGAKPGIVQLFKAFHQVLPTASGTELMKVVRQSKSGEGDSWVVDTQNGYLSYGEDDPDSELFERFSACVWRRSNGHSLLGVTVLLTAPQYKSVLCFFDYNPQTQMLTAEKSLKNLFQPLFSKPHHWFELPQHGKSLVVGEHFGWLNIKHTYSWDGMKPANPKTEIEHIDWLKNMYKEDFVTYDRDVLTQYSLIDVDDDGQPELWLRSDDGENQAVFAVAVTCQLLGGSDDRRSLTFYKNAVCHSGSCGALCMSSVYALVNESSRKSRLYETEEWDNDNDSYGAPTYRNDDGELSASEGEKIIKSLGEEIEFKPQWRKLSW